MLARNICRPFAAPIWSGYESAQLLPRCTLQRRIEKALGSAQFLMDGVASAKECLQAAQVSRYEGVLIDSDLLVFVDVLALVRLLRHENSATSIFVFSRYLDLEQRLCLFEAGVDDCVCGPFFASEMAARPQAIDTTASGSVEPTGDQPGGPS
jgi:DNA-binding response OmpR family regulator